MPNDVYEYMKMLLNVNKNAKIVIELHANIRFLALMNASSRYWSSIHANEFVFSRNEQQKVSLFLPQWARGDMEFLFHCSSRYPTSERSERVSEMSTKDLRSMNKIAPGFPVAEHFSSNGHTTSDALVRGIKLCEGNKQRKRQEMRLIFRLGKCQPRGLNADFQFI